MVVQQGTGRHGAPAAMMLAVMLLCGQPGGAEKPTYRSAIVDTFRDMKEVNITAILDSLQTGYDKRVRPNYGGPPVNIGVTMHILSISSVSEVMMDFTLDFYFRQHWGDPRLAFPNQHGLRELTVGSEYLQKIWVPDTFFANEKKSYFHVATTPNEMLRITREGKVLRSMRLTITASCPMNLQYFPMDRQLCIVEIESFAYSMDHIRLSWYAGDSSVAIEPGVSLPQFRVLGYSKRTIIASTSTGNYSRLLCEIMFVRSMGYYLIQIYIPSSLIVVISWVSFWLNRAATPARVSLGVTTVLTMTTLMSSTNAALPKISYVKSIDVYLGTCFVMVFASLLEYAAVGYLGKRIQMRKTRMMNLKKLADQRKETIMELSHASMEHHQDHKSSSRKNRSTLELSTNPYKINSDMGHHKPNRSTLELSTNPYKKNSDMGHHKPEHHHNARQTGFTTLTPRKAPVFQEVRYKVHDPKAHSKGGTLENTINGRADEEAPPMPVPFIPAPTKDLTKIPYDFMLGRHGLNKLYGCSPSDIDKYSRIVFPVCFVCFNLMYWIIYLHISDDPAEDLILHNAGN